MPSDFAGNYAGNIAAIYRDLARSQAEAKLRSGGAWGQAIGEIGQTIAGIPWQLADEKRRKQQDQVIEENLRRMLEQRQEDQWLKDAMNSSVVDGKIDERRLSENLNLLGAAQLVPQAVQVLRESEGALQRLKNAQLQGQIDAQTLRNMALDYFKPFALAIKESNFDPGVVNGALKVVELQAGPEEAARLQQSFATDPGALKLMVESVLVPAKDEGFTLNQGDVRFDSKGNPIASNPKTPDEPKTLDQMLAEALKAGDRAKVNEIIKVKGQEAAATRAPQQGPAPQYQWATAPDGTVRLMSVDEIRRSGAGQPATADMRNKAAGKETSNRAVEAVRALGEGIFTKVGPAQRIESMKRGAEAVFGTDPEFRTYQDSRMALAGALAVEQQGSRVSDADVKALWLPMVPDAYRDTKDSYKLKWDLIDAMRGKNPAPSPGADPLGIRKGGG